MMKRIYLLISIALIFNASAKAQSNFQITFNAGTGPLAGIDTVWMYAGAGIDNPGNFWQYIVGDLTNTGVGYMTEIGQDIWSICIEPFAYFSQGPAGVIPNGSSIYNISMIFHKRDFSIQVDATPPPNPLPLNIAMQPNPVSNWNLMTGVYQQCTIGMNELQISNGILTNYPNPARDKTIFSYHLKSSGLVSIRIMNTIGQTIAQLVNEKQSPGLHGTEWNLSDGNGTLLQDGIYFYSLEADGKVLQTNKLIISKK